MIFVAASSPDECSSARASELLRVDAQLAERRARPGASREGALGAEASGRVREKERCETDRTSDFFFKEKQKLPLFSLSLSLLSPPHPNSLSLSLSISKTRRPTASSLARGRHARSHALLRRSPEQGTG